MIKKVKNIVSWTCINDLNAEEILGKGNKLYIKWKGCNNSFNSRIDKKSIV